MIRKIIKIDEEKCTGCGICITACHEEALVLVDGKAKLISDEYCDGLGDCLPGCPEGAIEIIEREAEAYDEVLVEATIAERKNRSGISQLTQWPVQLKLAPVEAEYFKDAHLLIAADCTAFAYGNFHDDFMKGRVTLVGCPKLDEGDYSEKIQAILENNDIASVTIVKMEVPCCTGLLRAVEKAVNGCGKSLDFNAVTLSRKGEQLA